MTLVPQSRDYKLARLRWFELQLLLLKAQKPERTFLWLLAIIATLASLWLLLAQIPTDLGP